MPGWEAHAQPFSPEVFVASRTCEIAMFTAVSESSFTLVASAPDFERTSAVLMLMRNPTVKALTMIRQERTRMRAAPAWLLLVLRVSLGFIFSGV